MRASIARLRLKVLLILPLLALSASAGDAGMPRRVFQAVLPERLVSDNTFIYISTPDLRKAKAAFERSAFRSLLNEEEISAPVMDAVGKLRETYVKGDGTRSEQELRRRNEEVDLLLKIAPLLDGQVAISIEDDAAALTGLARGVLPKFLLIASMPTGEAGLDRQLQLEEILDRYRSIQTMDMRFRDFDNPQGAYIIHGIDPGDLGQLESWTFVENLFVYGRGHGIVEDAVKRYTSAGNSGSLAVHAGYQAAHREVGRDERGDSLLYVQIDVQPLVKMASIDNPLLKRVLNANATALESNRPHFALGIQVGPGEKAPIREKFLVRCSKELLPSSSEPCRSFTARFASSETLLYFAGQNTLAELYETYKPAIAMAAGGPDALDQRIVNMFGLEKSTELKAKLSLFKGEISTFVEYVPRSNIRVDNAMDFASGFQIVIALEIDKDNTTWEAPLNSMMKKLEAGTGHQYVKTTYQGTQIWYQKGAVPGEEKNTPGALGLFANVGREDLRNVPFFLSYAKVDLDAEPGAASRRFLLLSDDLNGLKKAIAQSKSSRTSLAEEKRFRELMASFRETRYETNYLDLNKFVDVYNAVMPAISKAGMISKETLARMPSANALRDHLFPVAWVKSMLPDAEGMLIEFSSPTGNLPMLGLIGSLAWPAVNAQRQKAISDEMDLHMKQISLGLHLYAADFDRFPPQLSDLFPTYVKSLSTFESPFNRGALNSPQDIDNPDLSNLIYVPDRSLTDLSREVIVYEKEPSRLISNDAGKLFHHVITIDGKMISVPKVALDRILRGRYDLLGARTVIGPSSRRTDAQKPKPKQPGR